MEYSGTYGEVAGDETRDTGSASECLLRNAARFRLFPLRNGSHEREAYQIRAEFWNDYSDGANDGKRSQDVFRWIRKYLEIKYWKKQCGREF